MQEISGQVVDEEGFELEIWVEKLPARSVAHVFVMYGGSLITDFPSDQPQPNCELCEAAQLVASSPVQLVITLPILIMED